MMQKKKIWIKLLSVILAVIVFLTTQEIPVFADIDLSNVTVVESITMNRNGQANIEVNLPSEVPIDSVTISYAFKDGAATDVVDLDAYTGYLTAQKAGTTIIVTTIKAVTDKPIQKTMETLVKVLEPADILDQAEKVENSYGCSGYHIFFFVVDLCGQFCGERQQDAGELSGGRLRSVRRRIYVASSHSRRDSGNADHRHVGDRHFQCVSDECKRADIGVWHVKVCRGNRGADL